MPSPDPIKRRLSLLENHFSEKESLAETCIQQSPLIFAALGIISGIVFADYTDFPLFLFVTLFLITFFTGIFFIKNAGDIKRLRLLALALFIFFFFIGTIRLSIFNHPSLSDISYNVCEEKQAAKLRGTVITDVRYEDRSTWKFGRFLPLSPTSSFYLDIQKIKTKGGWGNCSGKIRVSVSGRISNITAGDEVEVVCTLSKFSHATNPGQFDMARYMKRNAVLFGAAVNIPSGVKLIKKGSLKLTWIRFKFKEFANDCLFSDTQMQTKDAGLLSALLLGTRTKIDTQTNEAFRQSGLSHFISLSGLHIGILSAMAWWACRFTGFNKRTKAGICIMIIIIYAMSIPPRAATLRAVIICLFFFTSMIIRRKPDSLNTLSLAAIVLLLLSPTNVFNIGWQLSFTCVAGIILFYKHIEDFLISNTIDRFRIYRRMHIPRQAIIIRNLVSGFLCLLAVGLSAWLGGSGVMAYHFSTITPLSFLWTVFVYPVIFAILAIGYLKILLASILPTAGMILAFLLQVLINLLGRMVEIIAKVDFSEIIIGKVPVLVILLFYAALLLVRFWHTNRYTFKIRVFWGIIIVIISSVVISKITPHRYNTLEMTCLDVGHGQAIAIMLPDRRTILFDAGSLTFKNCGEGVIVPFLKSKGISWLDGIIISHEDIDHINGVPEIVSRYPMARSYGNLALLNQLQSTSKITHLNKCLLEYSGCELQQLNNEFSLYIKTLWPPENVCCDHKISANNKSQVCLIEYADKAILLCSDIEIFAQSEIFSLYPDLTADVVVMPHHGSSTNLLEEYAKKLKAQYAIISCSKKRANSVWKSNEIAAYYTPIHGAITIKVKKDGVVQVTSFIPTKMD